jgi:hypothetical protein
MELAVMEVEQMQGVTTRWYPDQQNSPGADDV